MKRALIVTGVTTLAVGLAPGAAAAHGSKHQSHGPSDPVVVVSGLNNPRQLSLVHDVELLIAEAGKGGTIGPITTPEGVAFVGDTGSISEVFLPQLVDDQTPHRILTGLMSSAEEGGGFAIGSDGVSARQLFGPMYVQETFVPLDLPDALAAQNGQLLKARPYGSLHTIADIAGFERQYDPDHKGFDSDPYAVLARKHDRLVADAAGNDILRVDRWGRIHVFHVFPNVRTGACAGQFDPDPSHPGCNFVPTSLATDRYGHVYVGGLSSLTPGEAQVVELSANGRHVLHRWGGFSAVTGVAVGRDGSLYVSQLFGAETNPPDPEVTGVLTKVSHSGKRTNVDVPFAAGVAVDRRNNVFVSAWSVAPDTGLAGPGTSGQVWRLRF